MDINPYERVSSNVYKKFGVYYLFDYVPDTRFEIRKNYDETTKKLSKEIQKYKDYDRNLPSENLTEFEFFTEKLMNAIVELSNNVIYSEINKIALLSVPSSTLDRDKKATMRESIKYIEKMYLEGKLNCNKEIMDCSEMLTRKHDVKISHSNIYDGRPSYLEHKKSIEFKENELLYEDVAYIILDDISTRGVILNACEDILIENGVTLEDIYKFAIFQTVDDYD